MSDLINDRELYEVFFLDDSNINSENFQEEVDTFIQLLENPLLLKEELKERTIHPNFTYAVLMLYQQVQKTSLLNLLLAIGTSNPQNRKTLDKLLEIYQFTGEKSTALIKLHLRESDDLSNFKE